MKTLWYMVAVALVRVLPRVADQIHNSALWRNETLRYGSPAVLGPHMRTVQHHSNLGDH